MNRRCLLVFGASVFFVAVRPQPMFGQHGPAKVVVAPAEQREVEQTVTLVGTVEPVRRSVLGAEVEGLVSEAPVREGDTVSVGTLLCALKDDTLRYQLAEARARLENLKSELEELETGTREEEKRRYRAELEEARAELSLLEFEKQRVDRLYESTQAANKEYRDTYAQYLAAKERQAQAQARYDMAVAGPRKEQIAQARHLVAAQQAVVDRTAADLEKTRIKAPFSGAVVRLHFEVGQWIDRGGQVAELIELNPVLVRVGVPEFAIPYCHVGDEVRVTIDALKKTFKARIRHIVSQADPSARTFPVDVEVNNDAGELRAGMFARVTLISGPKAPAVVIPKDAVVQREGVDYVTLVMPGQQGMMGIPTPVTIGTEDGTYVAVTSGNVPAGTQVVVRGNESIYFPVPVEIEESVGGSYRALHSADAENKAPTSR